MAALAAALPAIMTAATTAASTASTVASVAAPVIGLAGTAASFIGSRRQAQQNQQNAEFEAQQIEAAGTRERAAATQRAYEQRLKTQNVLGRQRAVAAGSGAGVYTPTVVDLMSDVATEGDYRSNLILAKGQSAATGYFDKAQARRLQSKANYKGSLLESFIGGGKGLAKFASSVGGVLPSAASSAGIGPWKTTVKYG